MTGFSSIAKVSESFEAGRTWISTFRKVVASSATITGQWYDYSYAGGNPIPNYYAASPLQATVLEPDKGIIVPRMSASNKAFLHRLTVMCAGASAVSSNQACYLMDYLLYYPFVDMDAAGEDQTMDNTTPLPRYTNGEGVQMMMVAQSNTVGGGQFTVSFIDADGVAQVTPTMFCAAAQPSGAIVQAVGSPTGLVPFISLPPNCRGVRSVTSVNFSVANGGLCAVVLVHPLENLHIYEECRQVGADSFGDVYEVECCSQRAGMVEIVDGAFLGFLGCGISGSLSNSILVGTLEVVWG